MIGVYDYTVVLTYLSLISGSLGIFASLSGLGHPYYGVFFLLFCGLCDAFDGKVASTKKNRTDEAKKFGIQIDSLSDLVAFGVLPAAIGVAMYHRSMFLNGLAHGQKVLDFFVYGFLAVYVLAALIRLAYFNVQEEMRQKREKGKRKDYTGLPVTSSALIFPFVMLLQFLSPMDMTLVYFGAIIATGICFLSKFKIKKFEMKGILVLVGIGALEFIALLIFKLMK